MKNISNLKDKIRARPEYIQDLYAHTRYCDGHGQMVVGNYLTGEVTEKPCPYCEKIRKKKEAKGEMPKEKPWWDDD